MPLKGFVASIKRLGAGPLGLRVIYTRRSHKEKKKTKPERFVPPWRIWLTSALAYCQSTNTHVPGCDQTYSNIRVRPGLSCISLEGGVAPGDLENCLYFTRTDQYVRTHWGCLPFRSGIYPSFGASIKLSQLQIVPLSLSRPFFFFLQCEHAEERCEIPICAGTPFDGTLKDAPPAMIIQIVIISWSSAEVNVDFK